MGQIVHPVIRIVTEIECEKEMEQIALYVTTECAQSALNLKQGRQLSV